MTNLDRVAAYARERAKDCRIMSETLKKGGQLVGAEVVEAKAEAFTEMAATALRIQDEATEDNV